MASVTGGSSGDRPKVIVVGGGLAGLTAALTAANEGAHVILLEGEKDVGGNSAKASSGINGVWTEVQKRLKIVDSEDSFTKDTLKAGDNINKADLVKVLVSRSKGAIEWLTQLGVALDDVIILGGHAVARTHWIPSGSDGKPIPVGFTIIKTLKVAVEKFNKNNPDRIIDVYTNTRVASLKTDWDEAGKPRVIGVNLEQPVTLKGATATVSSIEANVVILATGGFSNDHTNTSLLKEFAPSTLHYPTTNGPFATGTGVKMGRAIGAKLIDMDKVQIHPTAFVDPKDPSAFTKFLAAEALRGGGGLLLNEKGERFGDELTRRDTMTAAILKSCAVDESAKAHVAYLVMNEAAIKLYGWPSFNFYWKVKGFFKKAANVEEMCKDSGLSEAAVKTAFKKYADSANSGGKDEFGKSVFPVKEFHVDEPIYYSKVTPANHFTMGGLEIDTDGRVLDQSGRPISGLYAAGEVSGGVHGSNRLGGNSLLECVVFGTKAAQHAVLGRGNGNTSRSGGDWEYWWQLKMFCFVVIPAVVFCRLIFLKRFVTKWSAKTRVRRGFD